MITRDQLREVLADVFAADGSIAGEKIAETIRSTEIVSRQQVIAYAQEIGCTFDQVNQAIQFEAFKRHGKLIEYRSERGKAN